MHPWEKLTSMPTLVWIPSFYSNARIIHPVRLCWRFTFVFCFKNNSALFMVLPPTRTIAILQPPPSGSGQWQPSGMGSNNIWVYDVDSDWCWPEVCNCSMKTACSKISHTIGWHFLNPEICSAKNVYLIAGPNSVNWRRFPSDQCVLSWGDPAKLGSMAGNLGARKNRSKPETTQWEQRGYTVYLVCMHTRIYIYRDMRVLFG